MRLRLSNSFFHLIKQVQPSYFLLLLPLSNSPKFHLKLTNYLCPALIPFSKPSYLVLSLPTLQLSQIKLPYLPNLTSFLAIVLDYLPASFSLTFRHLSSSLPLLRLGSSLLYSTLQHLSFVPLNLFILFILPLM